MHLRDRGRKTRPKDVASIVTFVIYSCRTTRRKPKETVGNYVSCLDRCKIYICMLVDSVFLVKTQVLVLYLSTHYISQYSLKLSVFNLDIRQESLHFYT